MASDRFAALHRVLSATPSRRAIGRTLTGLAIAGALTPLLGPADIAAKKKKKRKKARRSPPASSTSPPPPPPFCSDKPDDPETFCGTEFVPGDRSTWHFCSGGVCSLVPQCGARSSNVTCDLGSGSHPQCCDTASCSSLTGRCGCSSVGLPCYVTSDCCSSEIGATRCVGFVCEFV
jgi:hypothetical protein